MKRTYLYIVLLLALSLFAGCKSKQAVTRHTVEPTPPVAEEPAWHTCLIQSARVTATINGNQLSGIATMQTVRDSMIIISVIPMLGIEMVRIEATPLEVIGIDKIHGRYAQASYAELNRKLTPSINWDVLQQLCTAELPTGSEKARLMYSFEDQVIELQVVYPASRQLDLPLKMKAQPLNRYTRVDVSKWL